MLPEEEVAPLYRDRDYISAYQAHTDLWVEADPQMAVGGLWEELGALQLDYLVAHGLAPHHRLLDVGCGTLRAGRRFIAYLDPGGYTGLEMSAAALAYAAALIEEEGLSDRRPNLVRNADGHLDFRQFDDAAFDFVWAQSVLNHLPLPYIEECFESVGRVMATGGRFFFTFVEGEAPEVRGHINHRYPFETLGGAGARGGLAVERLWDYPHPRKMSLAVARKA
jgi:SAM-dependent methyltransferase